MVTVHAHPQKERKKLRMGLPEEVQDSARQRERRSERERVVQRVRKMQKNGRERERAREDEPDGRYDGREREVTKEREVSKKERGGGKVTRNAINTTSMLKNESGSGKSNGMERMREKR